MTRSDLARASSLLRKHVHVPDAAVSHAAARVRLLDALQRAPTRARVRRLAVAASAVLAVTVAVVVFQLPMPAGTPLAFTVGADEAPGRVGAYVTPPSDEPLPLRFSEGSVIELQPAARARVTQTTTRGAVVVMETGCARVYVVHRPETEWTVIAGPYTIEVQGTSFDVGFDSVTQTLEVVMRSGVVSVRGPGIAAPVEIRGAQRFVHSASAVAKADAAAADRAEAGTRFEPFAAVSVEEQPPGALDAPRAELADSGAGGGRSALPADPGSTQPWSQLVARGEYRRVLEAAEQQGIDRALSSAAAGDLMALGNAARFSGRQGLASRAYREVRQRFAASSQAASAAFLLGRMAESSTPVAAIAWYDRYVTESPGGSFVAEALGRKMIVLKRTGDADAAQAAARAYLQRFPGGPYAGVAREMTAP